MSWLATRVNAWLSTLPPSPIADPAQHRPLKRRRPVLADLDGSAAMSSPTTSAKAKRQKSALADDTLRPARHSTVAQYAAMLDTPGATIALALRSVSTAESTSTFTSTAASAKRKCARSPVKAMAMADAGIEYRDLEKRVDELSAQARHLCDDMLAFADGEAIIPSDVAVRRARCPPSLHFMIALRRTSSPTLPAATVFDPIICAAAPTRCPRTLCWPSCARRSVCETRRWCASRSTIPSRRGTLRCTVASSRLPWHHTRPWATRTCRCPVAPALRFSTDALPQHHGPDLALVPRPRAR